MVLRPAYVSKVIAAFLMGQTQDWDFSGLHISIHKVIFWPLGSCEHQCGEDDPTGGFDEHRTVTALLWV